MKNRVKEFLKTEKISAAEFAEKIGVQRSSISHILSGRNNPSYDFIIKFMEHYPRINADWLLLGKGEMSKDVLQTSLFSNEQGNENSAQKNTVKQPESTVNISENKSLQMSTNDAGHQTPQNKVSVDKKIEKIVIFFSNKRFSEYYPE